MVVLLARRVPLGPVMLAASLALGLLFKMAPGAMGLAAFRAVTEFKTTVYLIIVLYLISVLENLLRTGGLLARMVNALRVIFRDHRLVASFMPAFIGFLPSAGGAMFSAPLVKEATKDMGLSPGRLTFINYWFRHIWEPVFPLYPGLILAAALAGLPISSLIYRMWPYTLMAVAAGWLLSWHGIPRAADGTGGNAKKAWRDALLTMAPVLFVIMAVLALRLDLAMMAGLACLGLAAGLRYPLSKIPSLMWQAFKPMTLLLIAGVMVFKGMLEASGAVAALPGVLSAHGIHRALIIFLLPFLTGILTGISQGYVAVSFPLLLGMMGHPGGDLGWYVLAFISGLFGVYLSPSHLCLVLTREYFGAEWGDIYRRLLPAALAVLALAAGAYAIR